MKIGEVYKCVKASAFAFLEGKNYEVDSVGEYGVGIIIDERGIPQYISNARCSYYFEKVEETKNYYVVRMIEGKFCYLTNATGIYSKTDSHKDITREWSTKYDASKLLHFKDKVFANKIAASVKDGLVVEFNLQSEDPERVNDEVVAESE